MRVKCVKGTTFAVDGFSYGAIPGITAYFLTHFHSDHYAGLKGDTWSHGPIYCSPITADLVRMELRVKEVSPVPLYSWQHLDGHRFMFLDANHCPGSVMILFETSHGLCILHCGDFRADQERMLEGEMLNLLRCPDIIYLDNTYSSAAYCFPPQAEAIAACIKQLDLLLKQQARLKPIKALIVMGSYLIGKERLLLAIANHLSTSIHCNGRKQRILRTLKLPNLPDLTYDPLKAGVHLVSMDELSGEALSNRLESVYPHFTHLIAFKPTGWTETAKQTIKSMDHNRPSGVKRRGVISFLSMPYSEHSSHSELVAFLREWPAPLIIPTVSNAAGREFHFDGKDPALLLERIHKACSFYSSLKVLLYAKLI